MPARKKSLEDFIRDKSFLARRHRALLASEPPLADPALRALQERYCAEQDSLEQLKIARALERVLRERPAPTCDLGQLLRPLGKPGSVEQVLKFFPRFLAHRAGPLAGKPFQLEPFQERFLRRFFARDRAGERLYSVGLLGIPKGNGKTPLAAGLGLYALLPPRTRPRCTGWPARASRPGSRSVSRTASSSRASSPPGSHPGRRSAAP